MKVLANRINIEKQDGVSSQIKSRFGFIMLGLLNLDLARVRFATQCTIERTERSRNKIIIYEGCKDDKKV